MNNQLVLFTNAYPFGTAEHFLDSELPIIARYFERITIQPMTMGGSGDRRVVPENVSVRLPILPANRLRKLVFGMRDLFRHPDLRAEFFRHRVYASPTRFYHYLIAVVIKSYWKNVNFDVRNATLYFYWGFGAAYLAPELKGQTGAKVVVRMHGSDIHEELSDGYLPMRAAIFDCADKICPVSENGKLYLLARYPQVSTKIAVARLGTRDFGLGLLKPNMQRMVLASCGDLDPIKQIHILAEYIGQQPMGITWHHFGNGPEMSRVKNIVAKHPENMEPVLHGHRPNAEVLDFYTKTHIDAFVSVSANEGVPVSIMEAMSFGIPVIATDVGGTSEILYPHGSVLLPEKPTEIDFSKAIQFVRSYYRNPYIRGKIREHWHQVASAEINYKKFALEILS